MAKYKLLVQENYCYYKKDNIYDSNFKSPGFLFSVEEIVEKYPYHWQLIEDKLPENWVIKITPENKKLLMKCNFLNKCINYDYSMGGYYGNKSHGSWTIPDGSTEISWDMFKRLVLVLKETTMSDKEIIGYKLKDGCEDYYQASCAICSGLAVSRSDVMKLDLYPTVILKLSRAGVLDLWFEPVYKQTYPDIAINGYKGEFFDGYVKFGCAKIAKELIIEMNNIMLKSHPNSNREIESVTIGKGIFSKDQIKEIAECYLNKK